MRESLARRALTLIFVILKLEKRRSRRSCNRRLGTRFGAAASAKGLCGRRTNTVAAECSDNAVETNVSGEKRLFWLDAGRAGSEAVIDICRERQRRLRQGPPAVVLLDGALEELLGGSWCELARFQSGR
jgi:hypothetical protein